ncbi:MAG: hypothetical protein RQ731_04960 [Anaerosomatales bacterium]|nr:hypothetical protein [Anaerosomatales bacterium]
MRRVWTLLVVVMLGAGIVALPGCKKQMVTVETGEIVLCTNGEIVSDTTEEIEVPADEVAEHGVTTEVITCDLHEKLAALYATAEQALADGDAEAAERAFAEIAETDASYRDTSSRLADLRSGGSSSGGSSDGSTSSGDGAAGGDTGSGDSTSGGDTGSGDSTPGGSTPSTPGDDEGPVGPIANLTNYIPDTLPGFVGQRVYSDPFVLFRDYKPTSSGKIVQLAVEVEQFKDNSYARANVEERVKTRYASNGQDLKIGSLDGYFGTRPGFVGLSFTEGPVFVLLEVYTTSSSPAEHKDAMVAAARVMAGQ